MTIKECIDRVNNVQPNAVDIEDQVRWLSFLDTTIIDEVLKTHEDYDTKYDDFTGYDYNKLSDGLIVPDPYSELYILYLQMKIHELYGETARYNNSATMFNSHMLTWRKHYNKVHLPISADYIHIIGGGHTWNFQSCKESMPTEK